MFTVYLYNKKAMSKKKSEFKEIVSFRLSPDEKEMLEKITVTFKTTKSEFLRDWVNRLLKIIEK
jgi:hypothetical protein